MPLRIRCRCGEELVLRFSEWVYFVIAVLVLLLLMNTCALLLVYFHISGSGQEAELSRRSAEAPPEASPPVLNTGTPEAVSGTDLRSPPDQSPLPEPSSAEKIQEPERQRPSPPWKDRSPVLPVEDVMDVGGVGEVSGGEAALTEGVSVAMEEKLGERISSRERPPEFQLLFREFSPLLRLLLVEAAAHPVFGRHITEPTRIWSAMLLDSDPIVRDRASVRIVQWLSKKPRNEEILAEVRARANLAASWLAGDPTGGRLLKELGQPGSAEGSSGGLEAEKAGSPQLRPGISGSNGTLRDSPSWERDRSRAEAFLSTLPGFEKLSEESETRLREGLDVLLAIDVSESMEDASQSLQRAVHWLVPSILWAVPGTRLGVLFYRDTVVGALGFDTAPQECIDRLLRQRAEGGGDVPEGVYRALKASLQLGRFSWRPECQKILVFMGDASPPYGEVKSLLSLAREARREAGYRIHAISLNPEEGRKSVPYFPELARAGGGLAVTVSSQKLPETVFTLLFAEEARSLLEAVIPALKEIEK